jgi:DNA-binding response OmpR family regulator
MGARSVLVLAELADAERAAIEQDCQNCNFEVTWLTSAETVSAKLISGRYDALVVHLQTPGAARACVEARKTLTRIRFPIMALADEVDDATFSKAFRVGVDDVIDPRASAQVSQRLAAIPRASWKPVVRSRGEALIIDPDNGRAEALSRLLKEAGYLIKTARDEPSAKLHLWRQSIRLVVVDNSIRETARWIKEGNSKEWHPIWIVRSRPDQMDEISQELYAFTNASAVNIYLGDADILYEANRLSAAYESRRPAAARLFHGTTVTFSAGATDTLDGQWIEHGSTYSVDSNDVAVRTLALPPSTELELSLTPPGHTTPITLLAEVTARRVFGPAQDQSAPPGFTATLSGDNLTLWREAVRQIGLQRFGPKWAPSGDVAPAVSSVHTQPAAAVAQLQAKSSQPSSSQPSSSQPSSSKPSGSQPTSSQPTSSKPTSSQPTSSKPTSSKPTGSKPSSSQPVSSRPSAGLTDGPESGIPATKPGLNDEPPSSQRSRMQAPADADGVVPIARVRLVSAGAAATGANRGTTPTLKSLQSEIPRMEAEADAVDVDVDAPAATPHPRATEAQASKAESPPAVPAKTAQVIDADQRTAGKPAPRRAQAAPGAAPARTITAGTKPAAATAKNAGDAASKRKLGWLWILLLLALVAGMIAVASLTKTPPEAPATPEQVSRSLEPGPAPPHTTPTAPLFSASASAIDPNPVPSAASSVVVAPVSASAAAEAAVPSAAAPPPSDAPANAKVGVPAPPKDASELAGHLGYLYVVSPIDTQVFVQGKAAGKTNSYLEVFCGRRYLRLGTAPGEWQSEGLGFKIGCQQVNQLVIQPKSGPMR